MKLIGRTFAILAAAMVVVGITFALGASGLAGGAGSPPDRTAAAMGQAAGGAAAGRSRRDHAESSGFSLFGIGEVLKNLAIVGAIVAVVTVGRRWLSRRGPGAKSRRTPSAPAPSV